MMNLSSLSKAWWSCLVGIVLALISTVTTTFEGHWDTALTSGACTIALTLGLYQLNLLRTRIHTITAACARAANGDLESRLIKIGDAGEVDTLCSTINRVLDVSDAFLREASASMEHARENKFYRKLMERGLPGSYRNGARAINAATAAMAGKLNRNIRMAEAFEGTLKGVVDTVASAATELRATAESVSRTAEDTNVRSVTVAAAAEEASSNVQAVASAAEEMAASVAEISRQVEQSSHIAVQAVEEAARTNATIKALADGAQRIGDVVQLINDIANQTNLLALNATIEAARAGEAGKGFAVVASEVKSLADQTSKATGDIGQQIGGIQAAVNQTVDALTRISATIENISGITTSIAASVNQQGAATTEIARNVLEAANGTQDVSHNIAGVTMAASETGAATAQVQQAATELSHQAEVLRREVDGFFSQINAAA
jgi:methyl-accepting chemotaxis protein